MSVYRASGSRFFQYDFQIAGYRFSGSTRCTDERDAQAVETAKKAEARALLATLAVTASEPMRLGAACERWWQEVGSQGSERDLKHSLDWICDHLGPRTFLHAITDDMVSRMVQARRQSRVKAGRVTEPDGRVTQLWRPISNRRVNLTTISLLRRVMRRARDNWDVALMREPRWKKHWLKETRRHVRELLPSEESALDAVEDRDFSDLRRFAIITGLRRRDVLLTWPQVDFEQAVIRVMTKGGVPRVLPLTKEAYAILWSRRGDHPTHVFTFKAQRTRRCPKSRDPKTGQPFLFVRGQRYPISYHGVNSNKRKWGKAGVDARLHDLRHTTGMRTLRSTGNLRVVQKLLGHSDIAITARFYTDATLDDLRGAMEATGAATKPAAGKRKSRRDRS